MENIFRTTKCFGVDGQAKCKGGFPKGFVKWLKEMGWWGKKRVYLCSGAINDESAITVDIRPEVNPTLVEDARKTSIKSDSCDLVIIDPPYTKELSKELYGTEKYYGGINAFANEASRICQPGGKIITLSYEIPKRVKDSEFIAVCGIYTIPFTGYMRCLTVSVKK
jgi:hypothetical protein